MTDVLLANAFLNNLKERFQGSPNDVGVPAAPIGPPPPAHHAEPSSGQFLPDFGLPGWFLPLVCFIAILVLLKLILGLKAALAGFFVSAGATQTVDFPIKTEELPSPASILAGFMEKWFKIVLFSGLFIFLVIKFWNDMVFYFCKYFNRKAAIERVVTVDELRPEPVVGPLPPPPPPAGPSGPTEYYYVVNRGDTMFHIAEMFDIDVYTLLELNPQVPNPHEIFVGEELIVGYDG